ncbi:hypothetical protein N7537_007769 [Penicillium hordei]|uniref:Uncharacterized protein n=1 Tax=Penicillium hordei TaxID=40994 RepID=A0AAD6DZF4_9EURO|nr:uncharacterized protein N7537_007769 [Penicillium hordei]KAJ5597685.1 hypothetical protein N7537_007769 [Penicillium hordei]
MSTDTEKVGTEAPKHLKEVATSYSCFSSPELPSLYFNLHFSDQPRSENARKCPVSGSEKAPAKPYLTDHVKHVFTTPEKKNDHKPFYHISHHHEGKVQDVHADLKAAGPKVEDGIHKAKQLLEEDKEINPEMVREALALFLTHSKDAQERRIPAPSLKDHAVFRKQRPELHPADSAIPTRAVVAGEVVTADTLQGAALLSYWRDDYDLNDSHYHWHIVYRGAGGNNKVNTRTIDRQGEIFLYTHSQMVARYEVEGLCWNLPLVRAWNMYDDYLEYGYQPLPALQEYYGGYPPYTRWYRVHSPDMATVEGVTIGVAAMETWRDNIYAAIKDRTVKTAKFQKDENGDYVYDNNGRKIRIGQPGTLCLTGDNAMNYIGGLLDAQYKFFDPLPDGYEVDDEVYGLTLHNYGLGKMAEISYHKGDPENGDYGTPYGLMISNFGAIRDPCFFPWYKHMQEFRRLVANNYVQDIKEHGAAVRLSGLIIRPQDETNPLYTWGGATSYMGAPAVDLLESKAKLDHEPYEWSVKIHHLSRSSRGKRKHKRAQVVTLRFFIAPKELVNDYHHWIEMDKVTVKLPPDLDSIEVTRLDKDSSVARKMANYSEVDADYGTRTWCRCGWPQNLMLPAGRPEGMPFVAFCMATDDAIDEKVWSPSHSFCGAAKKGGSKDDDPDADKNTTYPDPRGMGYPFNRAWYDLERTDQDTSLLSIDKIIRDNNNYPYLAVQDFNIYRQTQYSHPASKDIGPNNVTWFGTIQGFFKDQDKACMQSEYGYNLQQYEDVAYHHHNIYYATVTGRMPLQMYPHTQHNPDPDHPLWTKKMCEKFKRWTLHGCPKGEEGISDPDDSDDSGSEEDSELEETVASGN